MRETSFFLVAVLTIGCQDPHARTTRDGGADVPLATDDAPVATTDVPAELADAGTDAPEGVDAPSTPLGPPLARPPAGPPDHSAVIVALASERPDLLAGSCLAMGGTNDFLFEAVRRLRAIDLRYGLVVRAGALLQDRVGYFWGDGAAEGSTQTYVIDVIGRHCAAPGDPPAVPGWLDDTAGGGAWTIAPLGGMPLPDVDAGMPMPDTGGGTTAPLPLPNMFSVVEALAAERPDLLAASCVDAGGNNEFLFELVRRLRRIDPRFGLNWKRARIGDMSQDVVDYYWATPGPIDDGFDTYVVDVIGGHCGPDPRPAWIDVTDFGSTGARWTLAGRTDL